MSKKKQGPASCLCVFLVALIVAAIVAPVTVSKSSKCNIPANTLFPGEQLLCSPSRTFGTAEVIVSGANEDLVTAYHLSPSKPSTVVSSNPLHIAFVGPIVPGEIITTARALMLPDSFVSFNISASSPISLYVVSEADLRAMEAGYTFSYEYRRTDSLTFTSSVTFHTADVYWLVIQNTGTASATLSGYFDQWMARYVIDGRQLVKTCNGGCELDDADHSMYIVIALGNTASSNVSVSVRLGYSLSTRLIIYIGLDGGAGLILVAVAFFICWAFSGFKCPKCRGCSCPDFSCPSCNCCTPSHSATAPPPPPPQPIPALVPVQLEVRTVPPPEPRAGLGFDFTAPAVLPPPTAPNAIGNFPEPSAPYASELLPPTYTR